MVQAANQVPKRALGKTGVQVSCIGMGCSPFGHAYGVSFTCRPLTLKYDDPHGKPAGTDRHSVVL